jgi:thiamine kinase-like enzyme
MQPTDEELRAILESVPGWHDAIAEVRPLPGGITNRSVRVTTINGSFVVRVPGEQTEMLGIDRRAEAAITIAAGASGIGPSALCEIPALGTVVCDFIEARTATADDLRDLRVLKSVARSIGALHHCASVPFTFPIFEVIHRHATDAHRLGQHHRAISEVLAAVTRTRATFDERELTATLCHNDLLPANVLIDPSDRIWLIDYEYAGMNVAMFDLANLSVNANFDQGQDDTILRSLYGAPTPRDLARLELMKVVSECREGLWALVQAAISVNPPIDYAAYADERLTHAAELACRPNVGALIAQASRP